MQRVSVRTGVSSLPGFGNAVPDRRQSHQMEDRRFTPVPTTPVNAAEQPCAYSPCRAPAAVPGSGSRWFDTIQREIFEVALDLRLIFGAHQNIELLRAVEMPRTVSFSPAASPLLHATVVARLCCRKTPSAPRAITQTLLQRRLSQPAPEIKLCKPNPTNRMQVDEWPADPNADAAADTGGFHPNDVRTVHCRFAGRIKS
jgi:hypothetical protein